MTSTAHALVAASIASVAPTPFIGITLSFLSHFMLDSIPHWDLGTDWRKRSKEATGGLAIAETIFGVVVAYGIFSSRLPLPLFLASITASLIPDWLEIPWYIWYANSKKYAPAKKAGFFEKFWFLFYKIPNYFHTKSTPVIGIATQVATVAFFMFLLNQ